MPRILSRSAFREILARLDQLDRRVAGIEAGLESLRAEPALREELARRRQEIEDLSRQSLHVVDQLDAARQRVRELEAGR